MRAFICNLVTAGVLMLAGCTTTQPHGPVPFRTVGTGTFSAIREAGEHTLTTHEAWIALWARHVPGTGGPAEPPPVHFNQEMAVAVFLGRQTSAGYAIQVERAEVSNGELHIHVRRIAPPQGAVTASVLTSPFHIIALPQLPLPVVFEHAVGSNSEPAR